MLKPCRGSTERSEAGDKRERARVETQQRTRGPAESQEEQKGETACAVKVDYILLSRLATCCTLGLLAFQVNRITANPERSQPRRPGNLWPRGGKPLVFSAYPPRKPSVCAIFMGREPDQPPPSRESIFRLLTFRELTPLLLGNFEFYGQSVDVRGWLVRSGGTEVFLQWNWSGELKGGLANMKFVIRYDKGLFKRVYP